MNTKILPFPHNTKISYIQKLDNLIPCEYTLLKPISCSGIGLHTGQYINIKLSPASAGAGIIFHRVDRNIFIKARYDNVIDTKLSTVIGRLDCQNIRIATIEHLMAALTANNIHNVKIECDGPELPVLDGSAKQFNELILAAGRKRQYTHRSTIKIIRPIRVENHDAFAELRPSNTADLSLTLSIDFTGSIVGKQQFHMTLTPENFQSQLAHCRTFTFKNEIDALHKMGLAKGGSLENAIVVENNTVLNPEGLRCQQEFVKHKMLDAIGDLSLLGYSIHGEFVGYKSGHTLNNQLLRKLMQHKECWQYVNSYQYPYTNRSQEDYYYQKQEA